MYTYLRFDPPLLPSEPISQGCGTAPAYDYDRAEDLALEPAPKGQRWTSLLSNYPACTPGRLLKLAQLVRHYRHSGIANPFMASLQNVYSLADCVTGRHNAQLEDKVYGGGKVFKDSHLNHYENITLLTMASRLRYDDFNFPFATFEDLYLRVLTTAGRNPQCPVFAPIDGFGLVGTYDTALRIGYHISANWEAVAVRRVLPREYVYLHQGSREGFIHLVRKGLLKRAYLPHDYAFIKAPTRCFPKEISDQLEPYEIENFLCCMKDELAKL